MPMGHTLTNVLVHVVFSTKNREKTLAAAIRNRLHAYLAGILHDEGAHAYAVNGGLEHVHLLIRIRPTHTLADLMRKLKSHSSAFIRRESNPHFRWQRGYSAFSVSHSQFATVRDYINTQEDHHRRISFESEFISLLKLNEIEFDETHLWNDDS